MKHTPALRSFLFGSTLLAATPMLHAATLYWDGTDSTANADGGSGTWNNTAGNTNWDTLATAGANSIWTNGTHSAVFGGTAGTVTLGTGVTVGGTSPVAIDFNTSGYIVGGTQNLTFNVNSEIDLNGTTFQSGVTFLSTASNKTLQINTGGTSSIAGNINIGSGTVTIGGNATLTMSSASSTYTGRTVIGNNVGSNLLLKVTKLANLSQNSSLGAPTTAANGVITIGNSSRSSTLELVGGTTASVTNRQVRVGGDNNGSGNATILNNNTDPLHSLTFTNAAFNLQNGTTGSNRTLFLGGSNAGNNEIQGVIINNNNLVGVTANGSGAWELSGNNTYDGATTVAGTATLTLSGDNSGAAGGVTASTATTVNSPRLNVNSATALGTGTLTFGGGLATDTVRLDNTSAGLVSVSTNNAFALNRNFTFIGTQSLDLGGMTTTIGGLSANGTRNITVTANTLTFGGNIGEAAANLGIAKSGAGTLALGGANTYAGNTTVSAGVLALNNNLALQNSALVTTGAGTLTLGTGITTPTIGGLSGASGNLATIITSGYNLVSALTLNRLSGSVTYGGQIGEGATGMTLTKSGAGTQILSGANGYTGATSITGGTLQANNANALGTTAGGTTVSSGAELFIGTAINLAAEALTLNGAGISGNAGALHIGGGATAGVSGAITLGSNATIKGDGGTTLNLTGGIDNAGNTLTLLNDGGANFNVNTVGISGSGGLTKSGNGTVTLNTANDYGGATNVNGGTLLINGVQSAATGAVTVASGAILGGNGTVGGATTILASGKHNAGDPAVSSGVGSQTFGDALNYANASIFDWDLNANKDADGVGGDDGTAGIDFDSVAVTGDLNVGTTAVFNVILGSSVNLGDAFWSTPFITQDWSMATIFGKAFTSGYFGSVTSAADPVTQGSFSITGSGSTLTWTAVPEPSSALAGLLIAAGLLRRRRCA